jgi:DNA-binding NarL/FixJ family response regulator
VPGSKESGATALTSSADTGAVAFTSRELSILELVAVGCTNVQIGEKLHISKYTVAQHVAKMLRRVDAANRTDLVSRAYSFGILK